MGDATILLFKGSDSEEQQTLTEELNIFLKGSKKEKKALLAENPDLYSHFNLIWRIRNRHMVQGLPTSYIFFLKACYQPECEHPVCQSGHPSSPLCWYPSGPPISHLPLPVPDHSRPWGGQNCSTCKVVCTGHYCMRLVDINDPIAVKNITNPPSVTLKQRFSELGNSITDEFLREAAESTLLSIEEAKNHLAAVVQNRKRGAAAAAATRLRNRKRIAIRCSRLRRRGACEIDYYTTSSQIKFWIGCDLCNRWYCCDCEKLDQEPTSETYICTKCCT